VQRAIYLGDKSLADRARALIQRWREEAATPEERRRRALLRSWDQLAAACGYSRPGRLRVRKAGQRALGDRVAELRLTHEIRNAYSPLRRGRRPGRPAKSGLW